MNKPTNVKEDSIYYNPDDGELYLSTEWQLDPYRDGWIIKLVRYVGYWYDVGLPDLWLLPGYEAFVGVYTEKSKCSMIYIDTL